MESRLIAFTEVEKEISTFSHGVCSTFHPAEPILYFSYEDKIYIYDCFTAQILRTITIDLKQTLKLMHSISQPILTAVVLLEEDLYVYTWNSQCLQLKSIYMLQRIKAKKTYHVVMLEERVFYLKQKSKSIFVLDLRIGQTRKISLSKPALSIHTHPCKPIIAIVLADGTVQLMSVNTTTAELSMLSEFCVYDNNSSRKIDPSYRICFHYYLPYIFTCTYDGLISCWNYQEKSLLHTEIYFDTTNVIVELLFHPTLFSVVAINNRGQLSTFLFFPTHTNWLIKIQMHDSDSTWLFSVKDIHNMTSMPSTPYPYVVSTSSSVHPCLNLFYIRSWMTKPEKSKNMFSVSIYSLKLAHLDLYNTLVYQIQKMTFWTEGEKKNSKIAFFFQNECYFLGSFSLMCYSPSRNFFSVARILPDIDNIGCPLILLGVSKSRNMDLFLFLFLRLVPEGSSGKFGIALVHRELSMSDVNVVPVSGYRVTYIGTNMEFVVLAESGENVEVCYTRDSMIFGNVFKLEEPMNNVFWTPLNQAYTVLFFDLTKSRLVPSMRLDKVEDNKILDTDRFIPLLKGEKVLVIHWQQGKKLRILFGAILTDRRILIVDRELNIVTTLEEKCVSCLWLGPTLLYTTNNQIKYLTVSGASYPLACTGLMDAVLMSVYCDRVLLVVKQDFKASLYTLSVGLIEPLVVGFLHYFDLSVEKSTEITKAETIKKCFECYPCRQVSIVLVKELKKAGYLGCALRILLMNEHLYDANLQEVFELAMSTYHFESGLEVLNKMALTSKDDANQTMLSQNMERFAELTMTLGQFDVLRRFYEMSGNYTKLFYLYYLKQDKACFDALKRQIKIGERGPDMGDQLMHFLNRYLVHLALKRGRRQSSFQRPPEFLAKNIETHRGTSSSLSSSPYQSGYYVSAKEDGMDGLNMYSPIMGAHFRPTNTFKKYGIELSVTEEEREEAKTKSSKMVLENMKLNYERNDGYWVMEVSMEGLPTEMRTRPLDSLGSEGTTIPLLKLDEKLENWLLYKVRARPTFEEKLSREVNSNLQPTQSNRHLKKQIASPCLSLSNSDERTDNVLSIHSFEYIHDADSSTLNSGVKQTAMEPPKDRKLIQYQPSTSTNQKLRFSNYGDLKSSLIFGNSSPLGTISGDSTRSTLSSHSFGTLQDSISHQSAEKRRSMLNSEGERCFFGDEDTQGTSEEYQSSRNDGLLEDESFTSMQYWNILRMIFVPERTMSSSPVACMKYVLSRLEHADYTTCIFYINYILVMLIMDSNIDKAEEVASKVRFCALYKVICIFFIYLQRVEASGKKSYEDLIKSAHLSQFMTELPLSIKHRVVVFRVAIKYNLEVKNYKTVSKYLQALIDWQVPDKQVLKKELKKLSPQSDAHPLGNNLMCYWSMQLFDKDNLHIECRQCQAKFLVSETNLARVCPICLFRRTLVYVEPPTAQRESRSNRDSF